MGLLLLSTTSLVYLPCATFRAPTTCTITLLPFQADPGGAFDAPKAKCPPDRGSSDCVTGSLASVFSHETISSSPDKYLSDSAFLSQAKSSITPIKPSPSSPVPCPRSVPTRSDSDLSTPPLTPDNDISYFGSPSPSISDKYPKDALDFLMTLFPHQGFHALPFAQSVAISAPNMGAAFEGVVLELPGKQKTLYVDGKNAESVGVRESIVALLDLAEESLQCSALIIVLERSSSDLGALLHSLMYVGGTVVTKPVYQVNPAFVLVGLEI